MQIANQAPSAIELKARFKARCASTNNVYQNWQVRVHRSISWFKRATELDDASVDVRFMLLWVALNSLYARWDADQNAPHYDSASRGEFLDRILRWDRDAVAAVVHQHRGLIRKQLENPYLSPVFWRSPEDPKSQGRATQDSNYLDSNLKQKQYGKVLGQAFERLYVLRGQLMHGAATGGSKLNRKTLEYGSKLLAVLMPLILTTVIDHGCSDDWPELCYPPLNR